MTNIRAVSTDGNGWRRPDAAHLPTHSDRLHELARRVERQGIGGRTDPEQVVLGKLTIAGEIRRMARELSR